MTLPVRIEAKAWTDSRYGTVALYLGLSAGDAEIALIRCAAIWRWQTEHYTDDAPTYVVPDGVVIGALKSLEGPRALVAAGLAEVADGGLRIKGGRDDRGESRIDWYWRDRQQRSAAGKASESRRGAGGRFGSAKPAEQPNTTDGPPTAHRRPTDATPADDQRRTDSPDSGLRTPEDQITHTARARDRSGPEKDSAQEPPVDRSRDVVAETALAMHDAWCSAGRELAAKLGRTAQVGGAMPDPRHLAAIRLVVDSWAIAARNDGRDLPGFAAETMGKLVAVRSAKALADPSSLRWWAAPSFWPVDGIERDLGDRPEDAAARVRPGHGPRDRPPPAPPKPRPQRPDLKPLL